MTDKEKDFLHGLAISAACAALPVRKLMPIAWSYNGVVLPGLPEWDREKYPYAYIIFSRLAGAYRIYTTNKAGVCDGLYSPLIFSQNDDVEGLQYNHVDGAWVYVGTHGYNELSTVNNEPVWTNTDIPTTDGTLYLAASAPVPLYKIVGYSYNGTVLPKLPEWDREKYPYAYIWAAAYTQPNDYITMYKLTVCNMPIRYGTVDGTLSAYIEIGTETAMYNCPKTDGEFTEWEYHSESVSSKIAKVYPFWTNHDVINDTDGSVYLQGTDPIPMYE